MNIATASIVKVGNQDAEQVRLGANLVYRQPKQIVQIEKPESDSTVATVETAVRHYLNIGETINISGTNNIYYDKSFVVNDISGEYEFRISVNRMAYLVLGAGGFVR